MRLKTQLFTLYLCLCSSFTFADTTFHTVDHGVYISTIDCQTRNPIAVQYQVGKDEGFAERYSSYIDDPLLLEQAPQCHPNTDHSFKTYQSVLKDSDVTDKYDVGHLAGSNHLDSTDATSKLANQFSNLAPQSASFNRRGGAYFYTESIIECHRDLEPLFVIAGTIDDPSTTDNDHFAKVFGQTTPDYWYRVIYWSQSNAYKAWLMPNESSSSDDNLIAGEYDVSISELANMLPVRLALLDALIQKNVAVASPDFVLTTQASTTLSCRDTTTGVG